MGMIEMRIDLIKWLVLMAIGLNPQAPSFAENDMSAADYDALERRIPSGPGPQQKISHPVSANGPCSILSFSFR
jgi:hypothetical protein